MKRVVLLLLIISFFVFHVNVYADTKVDEYGVSILASEYKTLDITETIKTSSKELIRKIPLNNEYYDGKNKIETISKFKFISSNTNYKISKNISEVNLKLKSNNNYNTYVIKYKLNIGSDHIINYDELFYQIFPSDINAKKLTFNIQMPYSFEENNIQFNNNVNYFVNSKNIHGEINNINNPLNIKIKLKEGYFTQTGISLNMIKYDSIINIIVSLVPLFIVIIVFFEGLKIYSKYFTNKRKKISIKYSLPLYIDPAQTGYLYSNKKDRKQIISLILYCVNNNYFKMYKENNKIYIEKIKEFEILEKDYIKSAFKNTFLNSNKVSLEEINIDIDYSLDILTHKYEYLKDTSIKMYSILLILNFLVSIFCLFIIDYISICIIMLFFSILSIMLAYMIIKSNIVLNEDDYIRMLQVKGFEICLEKLTKENLLYLIKNHTEYFCIVYQYAYTYDLTDKWKEYLNDYNVKLINDIDLKDILYFDKYIK